MAYAYVYQYVPRSRPTTGGSITLPNYVVWNTNPVLWNGDKLKWTV